MRSSLESWLTITTAWSSHVAEYVKRKDCSPFDIAAVMRNVLAMES
jgi:hypothetical protein